MKMGVAIGSALIAISAAAQPPAAPVRTTQQLFDAATDLDVTGTPDQRLAAWETVARKVAGNPRSRSLVRIRKAMALLALDRKDEAIASLRTGLAELPKSDSSLADDRATAFLALGQVAIEALDYPGAIEAFREAEAASSDATLRLTAWTGLYRTLPFVDPDAAAATVARVTPLLATMPVGKPTLARLARYDAERLLNRGDFVAARRRAMEAVKLLGGLTERTDLDDVPARADVALAALLAGDMDTAREYMAMTGAGRVTKGEFDPAVQMIAPECGGDGGLKPQDVAVVEFSVGADGRVVSSSPIYAAGGGAVGLEFARAALRWSWTPEQLKSLPVFFRTRMRVEMRCSTASQRPGINGYLDAARDAWLVERGIALPEIGIGSDAALHPAQRAALAAAEKAHGAQSLALVPHIAILARNAVVSRDETNALAIRGTAILQAAGAPPLVRLGLARVEWATRSADGGHGKQFPALLQAALADPGFANDPAARNAMKIGLADSSRTDPREAAALLREVRDDPAAPKDNMMRTAALVRLASLEHAAGNVDAARTAFDQSGLSADQCALIDSPPRAIRISGEYPNEAQSWGFEGWAQVQYDVTAQGKTTNVRTVVAYPPFVFSKASEKGAQGARYAASFRPGSDLGCGGIASRYRFVMP